MGCAAFYLRLHPRSGRAPGFWGMIFWWCACGLIVIGACIGIVSTVFIVYSMATVRGTTLPPTNAPANSTPAMI